MKPAPIPPNEKERLSALYQLNILDTKPEERFDRITRIAVEIFKAKISTVTLIDAKREWYKSCCGCGTKREGERAISFCGHAVLSKDIFVITDTRKDPRFADNPMVIGKPFIRFYAGVPIFSANGQRVGVFCIKDTKPRRFSKSDQDILKGLASWTEVELNSHNLSLSLTERKKAEAQLAESQAKYATLLASVGDGVIAIDLEGKIMYVNPAARNMLRWDGLKLIGKDIEDVWTVEREDGSTIPREKRPLIVSLRTRKRVSTDIATCCYFVRKDKTRFPVAINTTPVIFKRKIIGVINIFRDITHEKEIDKIKSEFVALASHQLRTPLSAINWYAEMLLAGDAGKLGKAQKEYLQEIYASNKRMVALINSLLNVSRLELGGSFVTEDKLVALQPVAEAIIRELKPAMDAKHIKFTKKYSPQLPGVKVDEKLISIIFQNLLSNSIKYTPEGGYVSLDVKRKDGNVRIEVKDNGCGIPIGQQERVFTKLFRGDNILKKDTTGTGLGLYLVKLIVDRYNGKVWFKSKENKGTTFYITLPVAK